MTTISLSSNLPSLRAQNNLAKSTFGLSKSMERLSSGLRINRAGDDAAGLAIADSLRADARLASVAVRNANDGISLIAVAAGAMAEIGNILSRMLELANQSANGVYTNVQRSPLQQEFLALGSEMQRIAHTTTFNGIGALLGSNVNLQVGISNSGNNVITILGKPAESTLWGLDLGNIAGVLSYSITTEAGSLVALNAVNKAIGSLSAKIGNLGAAESRLETAVSYLAVARENFLAAESRIRDTDVAEEASTLVRLQVLQQAGVAVLAQANLEPEIALRLLQ